MAADPVAKLTALLADHERRIRGMEVGSQLGRSSLNVNGEPTTIEQIAQAAILADTAAAQAVRDAASALAKADGVVNSYFTDDGTPPDPSGVGVGDFWYRRDTRQAQVWSGTKWEPVTDPAAATALAAASKAQSAADGKISTYFSSTTPANPGKGDVWWQPPGNVPRRWSGTAWEIVRDGKIQDALDAASDAAAAAATAQQSALTAINSANGKTKVVYSTNSPNVNGVNNGDTWFQTQSNGTVIGQWNWNGTQWAAITPQSVTVASIDAGKITSGTLQAGVEIRTGAGGTYTSLSPTGLVAYVNYQQRLSISGSTASMLADLFQSTGNNNGRSSWIEIGQSDNSTAQDEIRLLNSAYNTNVSLQNNQGSLYIGLKSGRGTAFANSFYISSNGISSTGSAWQLSNNLGVSLGLSVYNLTLYAYSGQVAISANSFYASAYSHTFALSGNAGGLQVTAPPNGAYGNTLLRNNYYGGGAMKLTSDNAVQARNWDDTGYAYLRGIMQDQSSPSLKEDITALEVDALELLEPMGFYAWNWRQSQPDPEAHPPLLAAMNPGPKESGAGLLLSEMPWVVQPDPEQTGYNTGTMVGLLVKAAQQLADRLTSTQHLLTEALGRIETLENS